MTPPRHPVAPGLQVPLAGTGFTTGLGFLNWLQWQFSSMVVVETMHLPHAQAVVDAAAAELAAAEAPGACGAAGACSGAACSRGALSAGSMPGGAGSHQATQHIALDSDFGCTGLPVLYIYSRHLLPKPADWPSNMHVVGPLVLKRPQPPEPAPAAPLPAVALAVAAASAAVPDAASLVDEAAIGSIVRIASTSTAVMEAGVAMGTQSPVPSVGPSRKSSPDIHSPMAPSTPPSCDGTPVSPPERAPLPAPGSAPRPTAVTELAPAMDAAAAAAAAAPATSVAEAAAAALLAEQVGLPAVLQAFLDDAARRQQPCVYIGLGSMLGTAFEAPEVRTPRCQHHFQPGDFLGSCPRARCCTFYPVRPPAGDRLTNSTNTAHPAAAW